MKLNSKRLVALCFGIVACIFFFRGIVHNAPQDIALYKGCSFKVPATCKHLALLGCTPHPTHYIKQGGKVDLCYLKLADFLDVTQLRDSFSQVPILCKNNKIDHLLIAYLPIYFVELQALLKNNFVSSCNIFLAVTASQVVSLLRELKNKLYPELSISLVLPNDEALRQVPSQKVSVEDRIRYSIKQFPRLRNIKESVLEVITIINNKNSGQDDGIINYMKYEYLFEKTLLYKILETSKTKFHTYI